LRVSQCLSKDSTALSKRLSLFSRGKEFIDDIAIKTEGLTLAHLGEFIKSVFIFKNSVEDTLDVLFNMKYTTKNKDESPTIGFKK